MLQACADVWICLGSSIPMYGKDRPLRSIGEKNETKMLNPAKKPATQLFLPLSSQFWWYFLRYHAQYDTVTDLQMDMLQAPNLLNLPGKCKMMVRSYSLSFVCAKMLTAKFRLLFRAAKIVLQFEKRCECSLNLVVREHNPWNEIRCAMSTRFLSALSLCNFR